MGASSSTDNGERRRRSDCMNELAVLFSIVALVVTLVASYTTLHNRADLLDQKEGRKVAFVAVCSAQEAVIQAGKRTISGNGLLPGDKLVKVGHAMVFRPGPLTRLLKPYGYPSYKKRKEQGQRAARAYERYITDQVLKASLRQGIEPPPVDRDGTLDCSRLAVRSKAQ